MRNEERAARSELDWRFALDPRPSILAYVPVWYILICRSPYALIRRIVRQGQPQLENLQRKTFELCEFLHDVLEVRNIEGRFPHRVGLHQGCHGLRELRLGPSSEVVEPRPNKVRTLLESLEGIRFCDLERPDECCGFGGTFAVSEEAVSCMMGRDRIGDHEQAGVEVLASVDMSCLMHLEGLLRRDGKPIRVMHVAEILATSCSNE